MTNFVQISHLGTATLPSDNWVRIREKELSGGDSLWKFTISQRYEVGDEMYSYKMSGLAALPDLATLVSSIDMEGDFYVCMEPETRRSLMLALLDTTVVVLF